MIKTEKIKFVRKKGEDGKHLEPREFTNGEVKVLKADFTAIVITTNTQFEFDYEGVAKCMPGDEYKTSVGLRVARANAIRQFELDMKNIMKQSMDWVSTLIESTKTSAVQLEKIISVAKEIEEEVK